AERESALAFHHLLEHLDQDRDADRVDDLRLFEVQHDAGDAPVEERLDAALDFLAPLAVDVSLGPDDGEVSVPHGFDPARFVHLYFRITIVVPFSVERISTSSIRLWMNFSPQPRLFAPSRSFC